MANATLSSPTKAPWHLWVVGVLSLLWYLSGAYVLLMAQYGTLPDLSAREAAYYAAKPVYLELITDLSLAAGVFGAAALLLRRKLAVPLFLVLVAVTILGNAIELANGTSLVIGNQGAAIATCVIVAIAVFNWLHARALERRGVLT